MDNSHTPKPDSGWSKGRRIAGGLALILALIALPFAAKALGFPATVSLATHILIYGIAAASLNLALGHAGLVSFGHAAFFGIGGYVVGILYQHFAADTAFLGIVPGTNQLLIALPAAMLASGLLAALIGALSLRTSGVQFIMITLAFAQMMFFLFTSLKTYGGDDGLIMRRRDILPFFDIRNDLVGYYLALTAAALILFLITRITRSRFGLVLDGIRQSERRLSAIGVSPYRYKLVAFILSGMGTGLAGALLANDMRFVSPDMLHWTKSGELMIMVILGGTGTLFGPFLGAAALVLLETGLAAWTEHWQVILGPVLLAVVLFTKGGLHALLTRLFGSAK